MLSKFQGDVLSVGALLERAKLAGNDHARSRVGLRHTAAANERRVAELHEAGDGLEALWRFGILQTLDDYTSTHRRGGPTLGAAVFVDEPPATGAPELDAAFAALAAYLAELDEWDAPTWAQDPSLSLAVPWYASVPAIFHADADRQSPRAFRERGILITNWSLARA